MMIMLKTVAMASSIGGADTTPSTADTNCAAIDVS